jgi:hypothetical protein
MNRKNSFKNYDKSNLNAIFISNKFTKGLIINLDYTIVLNIETNI